MTAEGDGELVPPAELSRRLDALERELAEYRRRESELREREHQVRLLMDHIPNLVGLLKPNGEPDLINRQILDYTGKSAQDLLKWGQTGLVHPDDLDRVSAQFVQGISSREPFTIVYRMRRYDSTYRWFEGHHKPLKDVDNRVYRWCVSMNDIDDWTRARDALRESERDARAIVDGIPGFVGMLSPSGSFQLVNRRIREYSGRCLEELQSWATDGTVHADDAPEFTAVFDDAVARGVPYYVEQRLRRFDGVYRWFGNSGVPVKDDAGNVLRWYVLLIDVDERKRAEAALRSSELDLRLVITTIPGLICLFTPDGRLEGANHPFVDYCGEPVEQADNWATTGLVHPQDVPRVATEFSYSIRTGNPYDFEARVRRRDGVYRWFQMRGQAHRNEQGRIIRWYGLLTDIEDRKRAEGLLAGEKQLLEMVASGRALSDVLSALCTVVEGLAGDCSCEVRLIDAGAARVRQSVAPSLSPSYTAAVAGTPLRTDAVICGLAAEQRTQVIIEDLDADPRWKGSTAAALVRAQGLRSVWTTPVFSRDGLVLATLSIYRREPSRPSATDQDLIGRAAHIASITIERLQFESELSRRANYLATGERVSLTGSFAWQPDTDRFTFSEQLRRIHEFEEGVQVSAAEMRARVHPDDIPLLDGVMAEAKSGRDNAEYEIRLLMPDGRIKYVRAISQIMKDRDGTTLCIGAVQDVTRRRLAEDALDKVRSDLTHLSRVMSLGTLTASIAHEVNQPLAGIVTNSTTCVHMLSASPPNVLGALETARRTIRDARRASDVIARLRALFARRTTRSATVDVNQAAAEVVTLLTGELQRNRVQVQTDFAPDLPAIDADRVQLQQVILNLIKNGCEAMNEVEGRQRLLSITTKSTAEGVELTVKDAGVGYPPEDSERMFQAFHTSKASGMGVGLSVSRRIIESHRGRLWCELNSGHGATFSFVLPASRGDG